RVSEIEYTCEKSDRQDQDDRLGRPADLAKQFAGELAQECLGVVTFGRGGGIKCGLGDEWRDLGLAAVRGDQGGLLGDGEEGKGDVSLADGQDVAIGNGNETPKRAAIHCQPHRRVKIGYAVDPLGVFEPQPYARGLELFGVDLKV